MLSLFAETDVCVCTTVYNCAETFFGSLTILDFSRLFNLI